MILIEIKMEEKIKQQYFNLLNDEYNQPPKDVAKKLEKALMKNKYHFFYLEKNKRLVAGVTIFEIHQNILCIHELIVDKNYRNKGIGAELMNRVHEKLKGIFILKTSTAKGFYEQLGYMSVKDEIMIFINNRDVLNRDYWKRGI